MSFINSSNRLYGTREVRLTADFAASFAFAAAPESLTRSVRLALDFAAGFNFSVIPRVRSIRTLDFRASFAANFNARTGLSLVIPSPVLTELAENAFEQTRKGHLFANDIEIPFRQATFNQPKDNLGSSVSFDLSAANLSYLPSDAIFRFELWKFTGIVEGNRTHDKIVVFDNEKLNSRNLSRGWQGNAPSDNLSFSTLIDIEDKFALCPRKNTICFDTNKTQVSANEIEPLYDTDGVQIVTETRSFNGLSLYQVLRIAFVEGCGFSNFETNIPNYPLTRVDFSITQSYKDAVAPFIGIFKPIFVPLAGGILRILDGTQAIPDDFAPREITADNYSGIGLTRQPKPPVDGYIVSFQQTNDYSTFRLREEIETIETGNLLDPNYTKQTLTKNFRDYYDASNPAVAILEVLYKQTTTTTDAFGFTLGEESEDFTYDYQNKLLTKIKATSATVPLPANDFAGGLATIRSEKQTYTYQADRFNARRVILARIETEIKSIVATDTDNQYFDNDFKQEYLEAHRAGNLNKDMTYSPDLQAVKTIVETYEQTAANGQIRVTTKTIDLLRNIPVISVSEAKNGDISINSSYSKAKNVIVWRNGVHRTVKGKPLAGFTIGELPLFFGVPLVERILAQEDDLPQTGTVEVLGWAKDLERGTFATILDRDGANLGKYLIEGFSWTLQVLDRGQRFSTTLQVTEI